MANNVELGVGFLSIIPETSKIAPGIKQALGQAESRATTSGTAIGEKLSAGVKKTFVGGAVAAGAVAAGAMGTAMAKGFARLSALDQAQSKLAGLGHTAETVAGITGNALESVKGTAFGLGEAATTAAGIVAAGVKPGEDLERALKAVADTAAIAGDSMDSMGLIFGSVLARGKLQGDDLMQLRSRGIPVMQMLAETTGKTTDELNKMQSAGEITAGMFIAAMEHGMGGAALKMGDTFAGSIANMNAALGRFGAAVQEPLFQGIPPVARGLTDVINAAQTAFTPLAEQMGAMLTPAMEKFGGFLTNSVAPSMETVAEKVPVFTAHIAELWGEFSQGESSRALMESMRSAFASLADVAVGSGGQIGTIVGAMAQATAQVSAVTWKLLAESLNLLAPVVKQLIETLAAHPGLVTAFVTGVVGLKAVGAVAGPVGSAVGALRNFGGAVKFTHAAFKGATFGQGLLKLAGGFKSANPLIAGIGKTVVAAGKHLIGFSGVAAKLGRVIAPTLKILGAVGRFINPWVAGFTIAAGALTWFFTKTETGQQALSAFGGIVRNVAGGVQEFFVGAWNRAGEVFSNFTGKLTAGVEVVKALWQGVTTGDQGLLGALGLGDGTAFGAVVAQVSADFHLLKDTFTTVWGTITATATAAWESLKAVFTTGLDVLKDALSTGWLVMVDVFTGNWRRIPEHLAAGWEAIKGHCAAGVEAVAGILQGWVSTIIGHAQHLVESWQSRLAELWERAKAAFAGLRDSVTEIVSGLVTSVGGKFAEMATRATTAIAELPGKIKEVFKGASRWLFNAGEQIITGLLDGLKSKWGQVTSWARSAADSIRGAFSSVTGAASTRVTGSAYSTRGFAAGGRLPLTGPGADRVDGFLGVASDGMPLARVDAGEWIINRKSSERYSRELAAINAGVFPKLPGFATGGVAKVTQQQLIDFAKGLKVNGVQASRPLEGSPYRWGGLNWGDCSGAQSALARFTVGLPPFGGRFATGNQRDALTALGFVAGYGGAGAFNIGWVNGGPGGGHTSGDTGGVNFEMGGARGNGQIGGQAKGARNYPNIMHIDLLQVDGVKSTSSEGATLSTTTGATTTVPWEKIEFGAAADLWRYATVGLYDSGGWLPHGGMAVNFSGRPEPVFNAAQWGSLSALPMAVARLADSVAKAMGAPRAAGPFGSAQIVIDAEKGLAEARKNVAAATRDLPAQEQEVASLRAEISRLERDGGENTLALSRRVHEAERALAAARAEGTPDELAQAEQRHAQALEELQAQTEKTADAGGKTLVEAHRRLEVASGKLAETHKIAREAAAKTEAAERTLAAARVQAAGQMVQQAMEHIGKVAEAMAGAMGIAEKLAKNIEESQRQVQQLSLQLATDGQRQLETIRAARLADFDAARKRLDLAVNYAREQAKLDALRGKGIDALSRKFGQVHRRADTSLTALGGAVDRFRETGVFSLTIFEDSAVSAITTMESTAVNSFAAVGSTVMDSNAAQAAQAAELAEEKAAREREIAAQEFLLKSLKMEQIAAEFEAQKQAIANAFAQAEATAAHAQTADLLAAAQERLNAQAQAFYGMSSQGAGRAKSAWGGLGTLVTGIGKLIGGAVAVGAGFLAGGPAGAVAAGLATIPAAISGLRDSIHGGIEVHANREELKESWRSMTTGDKALAVLGLAGGAAVAGGGTFLAGNGNPAVGNAIAGAAPMLVEATVGARWHAADVAHQRAESIFQEQQEKIQREAQLRAAEMKAQMAAKLSDLQAKAEAALQGAEFFKVKSEAAAVKDEGVKSSLEALADLLAKQHDVTLENGRTDTARLGQISESLSNLARNSGVAPITVSVPPSKSAFTAEEVLDLLAQVTAKVDGLEFKVEQAQRPGALAVAAARR